MVSGPGATDAHASLIMDSYEKWTGKRLVEPDPGLQRSPFDLLFQAPIVVLSHGTEADPILNFGNEAALRLWEMDWATFTRMPSRFTAEPMERSVREQFLRQVAANGFVSDYSGIRISGTGRRFMIRNATVWNLVDDRGNYRGQAAAFRDYEFV